MCVHRVPEGDEGVVAARADMQLPVASVGQRMFVYPRHPRSMEAVGILRRICPGKGYVESRTVVAKALGNDALIECFDGGHVATQNTAAR